MSPSAPSSRYPRLNKWTAPVPYTTQVLLPQAIKSTSALLFLTLLWVNFTLLEPVDVDDGIAENGEEGVILFGRTWVDLGLNSAFLVCWIGKLPSRSASHLERFMAGDAQRLIVAVCSSNIKLLYEAFNPYMAIDLGGGLTRPSPRCADNPRAIVLLPCAGFVIILTLDLLQLQLVLGIARHAMKHGIKGVMYAEFWQARTGGWTRRIRLPQAEEKPGV